jgi:hypothetical protein
MLDGGLDGLLAVAACGSADSSAPCTTAAQLAQWEAEMNTAHANAVKGFDGPFAGGQVSRSRDRRRL